MRSRKLEVGIWNNNSYLSFRHRLEELERAVLSCLLKILLITSVLATPRLASTQDYHCAAQIRENEMLENIPGYAEKRAQIEDLTQSWITNNQRRSKSKTTYQIPVVVHVVWHEMEENISDEQILSQIEVLNKDFLAQNSDTDLVPTAYQHLIADTEISFCLANTDPDGNTSDGITRTQTIYPDIGTAQDDRGRFRIFYSDAGGQDVWDPDQYLNIWVARRGYGSGLASFPGTAIPEEDGLVIDFRYFGAVGTATDNAPYNLGRTVTHEVGHYFNLLHPWGRTITPDCEQDDEVEDTPRQATTYLRECPQDAPTTCETPDFFFNFMNYTDDACMAMFTVGQKMRMLATLEGPRSGLVEGNTLCGPLNTSTKLPADQLFKIWNEEYSSRIWIEPKAGIDTKLDLRLFNMLGQICWQNQLRIQARRQVDLPRLSPGIYLLHLQWQGQSFAHKLIIH